MTAILEDKPNPSDQDQEEIFEWVLNPDGTKIKITAKNSNGRRCGKCGCKCPCRCKCCGLFCCSGILQFRRH